LGFGYNVSLLWSRITTRILVHFVPNIPGVLDPGSLFAILFRVAHNAPPCTRAETEDSLSLKQKQQFWRIAVFDLLVCTHQDSKLTVSVPIEDTFLLSVEKYLATASSPWTQNRKTGTSPVFLF
jgi:hypothetical protein